MFSKKPKFLFSINLALLIVVLAIFLAAVSGNGDYKKDIQKAERYFNEGSYRLALESYEDALPDIKNEKLRADVLYKMAFCNYELRNYKDAGEKLDALKKLKKTDLIDGKALLLEAKLLHRRNRHGKWKEIIVLLNKAEKIMRDQPLSVSQKDLIELYRLRMEVYQYYLYSNKEYFGIVKEDLEKLLKLLPGREERAEALYQFSKVCIRYEGYKSENAKAVLLRIYEEYPRTKIASKALTDLADIYERTEDYIKALTYYRIVIRDYSHNIYDVKRALRAADNITSPQAHFTVPKIYKPGDKKKITLTTRNIEKISIKIYRIDLKDMFKQLGSVEAADLYKLPANAGVVERFDVTTGDKGKHNILSRELLPDTGSNGAYLIEGESRAVIARSIMLVTDMALVMKRSHNENLVWVVDAATGEPVSGCDILIGKKRKLGKRRGITDLPGAGRKRYYLYQEIETQRANDAGIYTFKSKNARNERSVFVIASKGDRYAVSRSSYYGYYYQWEKYRIYTETDRPVYRPGHTVHFKVSLREHDGKDYVAQPNQDVSVTFNDSKGNRVKEFKLKSGEYGSVSGSLKLDEEAPLGSYYYSVNWRDHGTNHRFRVEEYKKPEYTVEVTAAKDQYRLGKDVEVKIAAEYYFGEPVAGAEVKYTIRQVYYYPYYHFPRRYGWYYSSQGSDYAGYDDYRVERRQTGSRIFKRGSGVTNENGELIVKFHADQFKNDARKEKYYRYVIDAEVVDKSRRMIKGQGSVVVGDRAFKVYLKTERYIYSPGDKIKVDVAAMNLSNRPVAAKGNMILENAIYNKKNKKYIFKEVNRWDYKLGKEGKGKFDLKISEDGYYRLTYKTVDIYDKPIEGYAWFWVCSRNFRGAHYKYQGIEVISDKETYAPGETAHLLINSERFPDSHLLLTFENDDIRLHRLIKLEGNSSIFDVEIENSMTPNIWIKVALVKDYNIYSSSREIIIPPEEKFINVDISNLKDRYKPGEKAALEIRTTDKRGKPVPAEVSLGIVDSSIFYINPDTSLDIRQFFYGTKKQLRVQTVSSFDSRLYSSEIMWGYKATTGGEMREEAVMDRARMPAAKMKKRNGDDDLAEAKVREDFRDTAFWSPTIRTGKNGKAVVKVNLPESLTTWRMKARAMTERTKVGELSENVITRKNIMVRLQAPRFFTERDEVTLSPVVHNYLDGPVKAKVYLKAEGIELIDPEPRWVDIESGGDVRVDFVSEVRKPGTARITVFAQTTEESDAMKMEFPVIVHGVKKRKTWSGKVSEKILLQYSLPKERRRGESELKITLTPSIAGVVLSSLDYLVRYPYGCVEQTMSRFMPSVVAARTLKELGAENKKLEEKLPLVVSKSLKRLYGFQHSDGGWGWWKGDRSSLYMTAYVYYGLTMAKKAGYSIHPSVMNRARSFLISEIKITRRNLNDLAFALHAISYESMKPEMIQMLEHVYKKRRELNAYARALIAVVCANLEKNEMAKVMLRNLYDYAIVDKKRGTICWSEDMKYWWYWYNDAVETTAMALQAYLKAAPDSEYIPMIVKWLVDNREGNRWKSTRDTAMAVLALTQYLKFSREMKPDYNMELYLGDRKIKRWHVTVSDVFGFGKEIVLKDPDIPKGDNSITITKSGRGTLYYSVALSYFTKEEGIKGIATGIEVKRSYYKIVEEGKSKERRIKLKQFDRLKSGDEIEVELTIDSGNNYEYLVFEDYKPSGCEPMTLISGYDWQGGIGIQREMRDEKVVFFINNLPRGKHVIKYRLRAEIPGSFHTMPTIGYAMYAPRLYTLSDEFRVDISDVQGKKKLRQ